jgi:hypothetical protein
MRLVISLALLICIGFVHALTTDGNPFIHFFFHKMFFLEYIFCVSTILITKGTKQLKFNCAGLLYTWVANTYATNTTANAWANYNVSGFFTLPDGTVITNTMWDEAQREVGVYKNGLPIALVENTHGWDV